MGGSRGKHPLWGLLCGGMSAGPASDWNVWKRQIPPRQDVYNHSGADARVHCPYTPMLCFCHHHCVILLLLCRIIPSFFFLTALIILCFESCCLHSARREMVPQAPAPAICWHEPCAIQTFPYTLQSLSPLSSLPPVLALPLPHSSLMSLHLPHHFLPSPGFPSPLPDSSRAPCCSPCLSQHLHSPSPQPFYPSASRSMTGYANTGAWYPKQVSTEGQKSHPDAFTQTGFPAACWESASELLTQPSPPPCSFRGAWEPAQGGCWPPAMPPTCSS